MVDIGNAAMICRFNAREASAVAVNDCSSLTTLTRFTAGAVVGMPFDQVTNAMPPQHFRSVSVLVPQNARAPHVRI